MSRRGRLAARLAAGGPLTWVLLAWLCGPLPGGPVGATGQPLATVWWWHLAVVAVVAHWLVRGRGRPQARPAAELLWLRGRRWHTVVVVGWAVLATLAAAQLAVGTSGWGPVVTYAAAALAAATGAWRSVGASAVGRLAAAGTVLAAGAVVRFLVAAPALDGPAGFYTVKQQVTLPGAAHNVLAGLLLVGAAAVAVASLRSPRWRWALPLVGLGLGATLSRGALVAGSGGVAVAWWLLRDRALARRFGVAVAVGAAVVASVLVAVGAELPAGDELTSVASRVELWDVAVELGASSPLVGVGADGLADEPAMQALAFPHEHAHDLVLHAWATTGLVGLTATLAVWGGLLAGAAGLVDRDRRNAVVLGLAALGVLALVDEVAARPVTVGLLLVLTLAVAAPLEPEAVRAPARARVGGAST